MVAWLLLAFGLWVPLLYSLVYLIVVVIFLDVPLANTGTVYFVGLFISFLGALWFSMVRSNNEAKKRKRKKGVGYSISEVKKKRKVEEDDEGDNIPQGEFAQPVPQQPQYVQQLAPQPMVQMPQPPQYAQPYEQAHQPYLGSQYSQSASQQQYGAPQYGQYGYAQPAPQPQYEQPQQAYSQSQYEQPQQAFSQQFSKPQYEQTQPQENYSQEDVSFDFTQRQHRGYDESVSPWGRADRDTQSSWGRDGEDLEQDANEQPRIFRLRSDPDMLVYEFSNRLEFYRKTVHGNLFVRRQYK